MYFLPQDHPFCLSKLSTHPPRNAIRPGTDPRPVRGLGLAVRSVVLAPSEAQLQILQILTPQQGVRVLRSGAGFAPLPDEGSEGSVPGTSVRLLRVFG